MFSKVAVKFQKVRYDEYKGFAGKEYVYLTEMNLQIGDLAVVETPSSGYHVVQVVDTDQVALHSRKASKVIVAAFNTQHHDLQEEKLNRYNEIQNKLKERRKFVEERQIYQMLAQNDPEMKSLLEELHNMEVQG